MILTKNELYDLNELLSLLEKVVPWFLKQELDKEAQYAKLLDGVKKVYVADAIDTVVNVDYVSNPGTIQFTSPKWVNGIGKDIAFTLATKKCFRGEVKNLWKKCGRNKFAIMLTSPDTKGTIPDTFDSTMCKLVLEVIHDIPYTLNTIKINYEEQQSVIGLKEFGFHKDSFYIIKGELSSNCKDFVPVKG